MDYMINTRTILCKAKSKYRLLFQIIGHIPLLHTKEYIGKSPDMISCSSIQLRHIPRSKVAVPHKEGLQLFSKLSQNKWDLHRDQAHDLFP